jgi:ribonuclease VapC
VSRAVLDASAVLALLFGEAGADRVEALLPNVCISAVNYSECLAKMIDKGMTIENALQRLNKLSLPIVPFDEQISVVAASLRIATRGHDISFADRACLATAIISQAPAVTTDRDWGNANLDVRFDFIR